MVFFPHDNCGGKDIAPLAPPHSSLYSSARPQRSEQMSSTQRGKMHQHGSRAAIGMAAGGAGFLVSRGMTALGFVAGGPAGALLGAAAGAVMASVLTDVLQDWDAQAAS
jgi:hypothetical protein